MAAETCCSQPKEQQLYMLELLVHRLNLSPEKIQEIGSTPLSVRLEFLDFPTFEISEEEFWSTDKLKEKRNTLSTERKNKDGSLDFSAGKSCLFPKKPNELVEAMRSQPLKVSVYKVIPKTVCGPQNHETPICKSEVPLSGCLCDQVAMAANDTSHLPKPYTLRNTWNLIDEQGTPSGTILLFLRLTCLGKSVVTQFAVQEKSFLFKSSNSPNEFQCSRVPLDGGDPAKRTEETQDKICIPKGYVNTELDPLPKPRSVIGLSPICQELAKRDGGPLEVLPSLKLSTHRVVEENRALKTNVASTIQEPVCARRPDCIFQKRVTSEFPCGRGVCSGGLCAGPRIMNPVQKGHHEATNPLQIKNCCVGKNKSSGWTENYFSNPRMRGGGRWDEDFQKGKSLYSKCSEGRTDRVPIHSVETLVSGACKPFKNEAGSKPGCGCFGKLGTGMMGTKPATKSGFSSNNPCQGVDCLIRAFKKTQDFVDSIGKVPGLAGLGLMDPAESPFFGRDRDDTATSCVGKSWTLSTSLEKRASSVHHPVSSLLKSQQHTMKRVSDLKTINTILPAPGTGHMLSLHRDANALYADTISLASAKSRKRAEEKNTKHNELQELASHQVAAVGDTGPCGTPRCKSRKKKLQDDAFNDESEANFQVASKKLALANKSSNSRRTKVRGKSKSLTTLDPARYRLSSRRNSYIRVSKRIMRLVNAFRDPRFCHGHKNCLDVRMRVPRNMGWLWNTGEIPGRLKPSIGWKPGAISKFVYDRLQEAKGVGAGSTTSESRPVTPNKGKRGKSLKSSRSFHSVGRSPWARNKLHEKDDQEVELPPTLHIHRKDGTYYVTMYPIKAENINEPELQEKVKPYQFKITKNNDDGTACSSSSASDMEIEFSPPAAINRYRKKEPGKDQDTQVNQQEILDTFKVTSGKRQSQSKKSKKAKIAK